MTQRFNEYETEVLKAIRPSESEKAEILSLADELVSAVNESGIAKGMVTGSVARDTWISGDRDLDIFMLFSPELTPEELEEKGLSLAKSIAAAFGGDYVEKYAQHPYLNAAIRGFDVDLVPCYAVEDASKIKSAVDRTPFHTRYMRGRIADKTDDVRLLKMFSKACGVYGSDQMTGGFAGYLCEIFICYYGSFRGCLKAAAEDWHTGLVIDLEKHQAKEFDDPLTVIDPTDPRRNVAASLTQTRMSEFCEFARGYLKNPSKEFFVRKTALPITKDELAARLNERGTFLYGIVFKTPGIIPDVIVPQLKRSEVSIAALLERHGFCINRFDSYMGDDNCIILFEMLTESLPAVEKRIGPPVWESENSERFIAKHLGKTMSGPYIRDSRYYVEVKRRYPTVMSLFKSRDFIECGLGKHVKNSVVKEYGVFTGAECHRDEFAAFLGEFFEEKSPLVKILERN
ncbi:MAG: CCA tRNA nucleotidyltransferase [Methanomicrobium sp.]|nr:CCA tRNA nucleotidyltransferase [Methanomicrobium sp.]